MAAIPRTASHEVFLQQPFGQGGDDLGHDEVEDDVPKRVASSRANAGSNNWSKAFRTPPGSNMALSDDVPKVVLDAGIMQNRLSKEPCPKTVIDLWRKAHIAKEANNGLVGTINEKSQLANNAVEGGNQVNTDLP